MRVAYVDSSVLVAITFQEERSANLEDWLNGFDRLTCSNLVEAEVKSACARESIELVTAFMNDIVWLFPDRPISPEIVRVLAAGYLRGADLWHVATALYFASEPENVAFLTLDIRQRDVAEALGFRIT
ncbi:MAG: type II toxin-antitoxin system VapC family toxin [Chloroflexi bacterium]|nr:type II toxin-antitoxin system VapC family toxin [Chloroflexota bacterium]